MQTQQTALIFGQVFFSTFPGFGGLILISPLPQYTNPPILMCINKKASHLTNCFQSKYTSKQLVQKNECQCKKGYLKLKQQNSYIDHFCWLPPLHFIDISNPFLQLGPLFWIQREAFSVELHFTFLIHPGFSIITGDSTFKMTKD